MSRRQKRESPDAAILTGAAGFLCLTGFLSSLFPIIEEWGNRIVFVILSGIVIVALGYVARELAAEWTLDRECRASVREAAHRAQEQPRESTVALPRPTVPLTVDEQLARHREGGEDR